MAPERWPGWGTALDQYQVRKRSAWYRHVTLAICAHAWLAVTSAESRPPPEGCARQQARCC